MHFSDSPSSTSTPISIGFPTSPSSVRSSSSTSSTFSASSCSSRTLTCAYPSWPTTSTLSPASSYLGSPTPSYLDSPPNSFISDEDLFGDVEPMLLTEAPAPPRQYNQVAQPLLPLYASAKPYGKEKKRRRSSGKKSQKGKNNMETIVEGRESG